METPEEIFMRNAKKGMKKFSEKEFKNTHPTLLKVITKSQIEYAKQLVSNK